MKFFTDHLRSVEESYLQHLKFGLSAGALCILLGFLSIVHAMLPFLLQGIPEKKYRYLDKSLVKPRLDRIEKNKTA